MQQEEKDNDKYWILTPLGVVHDAGSIREAMMKLENHARCFYQKDDCWGAIIFGEKPGGFFASVERESK